MARFPSTEQGVVELAQRMIAGLTEHSADFPTVTAVSVQAPLDDYMEKKNAYEDAKSLVSTTLEEKDAALAVLIDMMKTDLKKAEIDVGEDSPKLTEIGWGPRAEPQPTTVPGCPTELDPVAEGTGLIWLKWKKPAADTGGPVRNYIIERRQQGTDGQFGPWSRVDTTYNCEFNLTNQPAGVKLEYRVRASNIAGESIPSNTISVVLP